MRDFFTHLAHEFDLPLENQVLIFSLILFIILLAPIFLKRLNIPGIIGLIISGVVIGPFGLGILENDSAIRLFSTIGLLYIMFIAGLELDMNDFRANRNKSLLFGFFTFAIPMSIGFPVCYYILGYGFNASMLTASMFATHTLVTYPIVSKLGVSKNQAVAITVGGTILTDTAVLIILAVIMGNHQGDLNQEFWIKLGISLAIFTIIMFSVIPRIAKWFFQKMESERHAHYIFVLAIVFFAAFLAELAGMEAIIGAFIAGLALNRLIPHTSPLMNRIEFMGNSLFIPFFLISVGMLVDVRVLMSDPSAIIIAGTLSIVALSGKWLAAKATQFSFGFSRAQGQLIFGLSGVHAAATLAVVLVGYEAGILDERILNGTVILILIDSIVASFATEKAAKELLMTSEKEEARVPQNDQALSEHILLPIADTSRIGKLLDLALMVKDPKSNNPISILSVVPNDAQAEINIVKSRNKLEEYVKQASATEIKVNVIATIDHNIASGISRTSREIMADIIVIGWPQRMGLIEKLIGERIDSIINHVDKNLFVCHLDTPLISNKRIVLIAPPLAEWEVGFGAWLDKVIKCSRELSIPIQSYGDSDTHEAIKKYLSKNNIKAGISYHLFNEWADFPVLARHVRNDDLLILAAARKGSISHMDVLDKLPTKLEKHFEKNSKIVIYPQQRVNSTLNEAYEIAQGPLSKGIETISKEIGSIFRKHGKS